MRRSDSSRGHAPWRSSDLLHVENTTVVSRELRNSRRRSSMSSASRGPLGRADDDLMREDGDRGQAAISTSTYCSRSRWAVRIAERPRPCRRGLAPGNWSVSEVLEASRSCCARDIRPSERLTPGRGSIRRTTFRVAFRASFRAFAGNARPGWNASRRTAPRVGARRDLQCVGRSVERTALRPGGSSLMTCTREAADHSRRGVPAVLDR